MNQPISVSKRLLYLDWLRVLAVLAVFIFHSGRFFDQYPWHVKNAVTYASVQFFSMFFSSWGMPLIFVISGASLYFAVDKMGKFVVDKTLRLLVPLVVGVFTHISIAVYLERLTRHQFFGSFFEFYPTYFQGMYDQGGNFAWMGLHLWYLLVLFVYSLVFLPVFYVLKLKIRPALDWLGRAAVLPGVVYLLALPVMAIAMRIDPTTPLGNHNMGGWSVLAYIPFLFYGFLFSSNAGLQARLKDGRWVTLALSLAVTCGLVYAYNLYGNTVYPTRPYAIINGGYALMAWLWILTIFGFAIRHLNFARPVLAYANEAVLPFYILHQTVLLVIGFYVTSWRIPDLAKFGIIASSSFVVVMALYEFAIRRVNILRVLFGMKARPALKPSLAPAAGEAD